MGHPREHFLICEEMMNDQPNFIDFAAIQIFAAMNTTIRENTQWEDDAKEAWRLAKLLHDSKPKDAPDGPT